MTRIVFFLILRSWRKREQIRTYIPTLIQDESRYLVDTNEQYFNDGSTDKVES